MDTTAAAPARCVLVWTATTVTAALASLASWPAARPDLHEADFVAVFVACSAWALIGCSAWGWAAASALLLSVARGRATSGRGLPAPVRRLLLRGCGLALVGAVGAGALAPAGATPGQVLQDQRTHPTSTSPQEPTTRPAPRARPEHKPAHTRRAAEPQQVVVTPGDSLWRIAADRLGPGADDAAIAAYWPRVHAANRAVVGPDPDLIHPGQRLVLPDPHHPS